MRSDFDSRKMKIEIRNVASVRQVRVTKAGLMRSIEFFFLSDDMCIIRFFALLA